MRDQMNAIVDFLNKNGTAWTGKFMTEMEVANRTYEVCIGCETSGVSMEIEFPIQIQTADMADAEEAAREINAQMEFGTLDLQSRDGIPVLKLYAVRQLPDKSEVSAETLEMLLSYAKGIIEAHAQKIYDAVTLTEADQRLTMFEKYLIRIGVWDPHEIVRKKRQARLNAQRYK